MPVLKDYRQTKEITLPSFPESKVVIYSGVLVADSLSFKGSGTEAENALAILPRVIKSWNFTKEDGSEMPIDISSLSLLPTQDVTFIMEAFVAFSNEQKKN